MILDDHVNFAARERAKATGANPFADKLVLRWDFRPLTSAR